jgi:uncharacterized protein (DUF934 family)
MNFIDTGNDPWHEVTADDSLVAVPAAEAHALLSIEQWRAVRHSWPDTLPVGLSLANDVDVEGIARDLPRLALVALRFPKWVDGRAYSQARLLRARYRFAGQIRATGEVLVDMLPLLARTGFDAAVLRPDQSLATARRVLGFFPQGHYQGDVIEPLPLFTRAGESVGAAAAAAAAAAAS